MPFKILDKQENKEHWNNGELPVGLIHPASAGHGLNLQSGGNILVWFGLTFLCALQHPCAVSAVVQTVI